MKKARKSDSLVTKAVLTLILCSAVFMLIAMPLTREITFNTFYPFIVEYITYKTGNSAARMSRFLGYSNPRMYGLTLTDEFKSALTEYVASGAGSGIGDSLEPYEITVDFAEDFKYSCVCYPAVYTEQAGLIHSEKWDGTAAENLVLSEWFGNYKGTAFGRYLFTPACPDSDGEPCIGYVYSGYADRDSALPYYSILMFRIADLMPLWREVTSLGVEDFAFIGGNNEILYANSKSSHLDLDWIASELTSDRQHHVVKNTAVKQTYYSVLVSYEREGLRFVMRVPESVFYSMFKSNIALVQLTNLALMAIFITAIIVMSNHVFRRMKKLSDKMELVQNGDYSVRASDSPSDEIGRLGAAFNAMTGTIQDNVDKLLEKEKREKLLQYNLMVSAIDPHFINNTLNTSTRLAELGRTEDVVAVNDALINFLKDNLKMKSYQTFDTVENELNALEQYMIIQNYLCDNTVAVEYGVSPEDMSIKIPKFLLQPLVENAILHGIVMNVDENGQYIGGRIIISVTRDSEHIYISVKDNGVGMDGETVKRYFIDRQEDSGEVSHEHIGVMNMRIRLNHLYGDDWSMSVASEPNAGTEIVISLKRLDV